MNLLQKCLMAVPVGALGLLGADTMMRQGDLIVQLNDENDALFMSLSELELQNESLSHDREFLLDLLRDIYRVDLAEYLVERFGSIDPEWDDDFLEQGVSLALDPSSIPGGEDYMFDCLQYGQWSINLEVPVEEEFMRFESGAWGPFETQTDIPRVFCEWRVHRHLADGMPLFSYTEKQPAVYFWGRAE